ncbi:hypothetical protein ACA910_010820 [Epithemia clementina (nom. ined.)]
MTTTDLRYCVEFADVEAAARRIEGLAHRTPVFTCSSINLLATTGGQTTTSEERKIFFKVEALQRTGSFKFRGALNAILALREEREVNRQDKDELLEVVTHSSGNHAQALALAARMSSAKATIVMPFNTPMVKKNAVQDFGAQIVMVDNTNEARELEAENIRKTTGATFVHPSEDPKVIAGQGTVCLELVQQMNELYNGTKPDVVIIPVGGGGLASGNLISLRALLSTSVKLVLAEPKQLDDAYRSFTAGQLLQHSPENKLESVADGLKTTLGPNTWPIVRDLADDIITVDEKEILRATLLAWQRLTICIEPSAGVGLAVACCETFNQRYPSSQFPNVGVVLCGGNVDVLEIAAKMKAIGL